MLTAAAGFERIINVRLSLYGTVPAGQALTCKQNCSYQHVLVNSMFYTTTSNYVHPTRGKQPMKAIDRSHQTDSRILFTLPGNRLLS